MERGRSGEDHICICLLISKTTKRKKESVKKRGEELRADPYVFEYAEFGTASH
jgi:hypothetical protein